MVCLSFINAELTEASLTLLSLENKVRKFGIWLRRRRVSTRLQKRRCNPVLQHVQVTLVVVVVVGGALAGWRYLVLASRPLGSGLPVRCQNEDVFCLLCLPVWRGGGEGVEGWRG